MAREIATIGGGCFWCMEAVYQKVVGVDSVISGYSGGIVEDPNYELVSTGTSGHAEVVEILFDPDLISFREILSIFFTIHDPTTLNRQGLDVGPQYRSVILHHTSEQEQIAREMIEVQGLLWPDPVVTSIEEFTGFYPAETFHQNFFRKHPEKDYCVKVIAPKIDHFRSTMARFFKEG